MVAMQMQMAQQPSASQQMAQPMTITTDGNGGNIESAKWPLSNRRAPLHERHVNESTTTIGGPRQELAYKTLTRQQNGTRAAKATGSTSTPAQEHWQGSNDHSSLNNNKIFLKSLARQQFAQQQQLQQHFTQHWQQQHPIIPHQQQQQFPQGMAPTRQQQQLPFSSQPTATSSSTGTGTSMAVTTTSHPTTRISTRIGTTTATSTTPVSSLAATGGIGTSMRSSNSIKNWHHPPTYSSLRRWMLRQMAHPQKMGSPQTLAHSPPNSFVPNNNYPHTYNDTLCICKLSFICFKFHMPFHFHPINPKHK
jgi:hypothetical protein